MASRDLRVWLASLEEAGELVRVKAEVDWNEEIGAISREMLTRQGPAILFEQIKGYSDTPCRRLLTNPLGGRDRVRLALGLPRETSDREMTRILKERFSKRVAPRVVKDGPVKESLIQGNTINLFDFPVPLWHPEDGGRYINTHASTITKDPETGELNAGTYRGMVAGERTIGILLAKSQDWGKHFEKYRARNEEMPVAVVIGWDPTLFLSSATPLTHPEYEVAGSLRGVPVELVKCETSDLLVPASAEIVIEGKISPNPETFVMEGPFGEYTGYYGGLRSLKPAIRVECITHRRDPILTGIHVGATPGCPSDNAHWMGASWSAAVWVAIEELGIPGVTDISFGHWPEVMKVQIKKSYQGQAKHLASAIWGTRVANYGAKILIVVDEEIDIRDHDAIEWALAYRLNPAMGGVTLYGGTIGSLLDPSVPQERRDPVKYGQGVWTRLLLDATINWELEPRAEYGGKRYPPLATDLSPAMRALVRERWEEYGFHGIGE